MRRRFFGPTSSAVKMNRIFLDEDDARSKDGGERAKRARGPCLASERASERASRDARAARIAVVRRRGSRKRRDAREYECSIHSTTLQQLWCAHQSSSRSRRSFPSERHTWTSSERRSPDQPRSPPRRSHGRRSSKRLPEPRLSSKDRFGRGRKPSLS